MSARDGGPAFPVECSFVGEPHGVQTGNTTGWVTGLTIRDYFAAAALTVSLGDVAPEELAKYSYQIADAMLVERAK